MELIAETVDALLGAALFLVAPGTAEGGIKLIVIQCLLERIGLHDLGMLFRSMRKRTDLVLTLRIGPYLDIHFVLFRH